MNNIYTGLPATEKIKIIQFAKDKLLLNGIIRERGIDIEDCPNRDILARYFVEFSSYPANDYYDAVDNWIIKTSKIDTGFVYFITTLDNKYCKIGYSKNPEQRVKSIETHAPFDVEIKKLLIGGVSEEKEFHNMFSEYKIRNEWFLIEGSLKEYLNI